MDTTDEQLLPQNPVLVFQVLHYHRSSLGLDSPLVVHRIGIYHTLALAQAAALFELQRTLNDYLRIGYYGRYSDRMDCNLRGLITACRQSTLDGYMLMREIPVSEFRLEALNMSLEAWEEETRLAEEELRFGKPSRHIISNMQAIGTAMPVVRLPVTPEQHKKLGPPTCIAKRGEHIAMHEPALLSLQFPPLGVQYDEERQPEWSQTRMPWFDRRDDAPFRGPGQTPYAQVMVFSPGAPTLATHSVHLNSEHSMEGAIAAS